MDRNTKIGLLVVIVGIAIALTMIILSGPVNESGLMILMFVLIVMVPLMCLSAYMWVTGKGAVLIAGFNTSPKAVRDLYDSTALAKFVGMLVTVFSVILLLGMVSLILFDNMVLFTIALIIATAILSYGLYYVNTGNRFLKEGKRLQDAVISEVEKKRNRNIAIAGIASVIIILIAVFLFIASGSVDAQLEPDALWVKAPLVDEHVLYENMTSVELRDHFDNGRRVGGFGGTEVSSGNFRNDEFGNYVLARYNSVERCIVVHHSDGVLVFNLSTVEGTSQQYEELRSKL